MALVNKSTISLATVLALGGLGYLAYNANAVQGQGVLAQAPLNIQSNTKPAFVMAIDDSGSMTFQTMFPGQDGEACWSNGSFFSGTSLRTSGECNYFYVLPGPRIGGAYYGIPQFDKFGFARSPDFNPSYYSPFETYEPWINSDLESFGDAGLSSTRIDPRDDDSINLFSDRFSTSNDERAVIRNGMVIPANTRWRYGNNTYQLNYDYTWTNGGAYISVEYYPATFYLKSNATLPGYTAPVRIDDACGTGCDLYRYRPNTTATRQNFANWFSYYGNRNRAMVAGMTRAMLDVNNMSVGYFQINQHGSFNNPIGSAGERVSMRDMATPAGRTSLYEDMLDLPASGGTPNRQAVQAAGLQFTRTDSGAPVQLSCQKNAIMLFTDGYSNNGGPTVGNNDGGMGAPFSDGHSNTMADIATQYYLNVDGSVGSAGTSPLRTDLAKGNVPVPEACKGANPDPSLDCQSNLHVNFYGVTLGARGNLYNPNLDQNAYTTPGIYNNWPARQDDQPSTVDDIWHAAVNTRGEYINAKTPRDITEAMRRILATVGGGQTPSGSIALTGARVGTGSFTVAPRYASENNGTDWYSTLTAQSVASDPLTGAVSTTTLWEAASKLPAAASRRIYVGKTTGNVVPTVSPFTSSSVTLAELCGGPLALCSTGSTGRKSIQGGLGVSLVEAVSYLRGDQALETSTTKPLRKRTTRLGDIVNSSPVITSPFNDYGYQALRGATAGSYDPYNYGTYLESKESRDPMVFVGANDGMLHAFNGKTGVEEFAYIPSAALGHIGNLLFPYKAADKNDQVFDHRYYVDGPINVSDAYVGGSWKTVLVGSLGAGGRGAFALDVSNPSTFGTGSVLWDINDKVSNATIRDNIGHVLGRPVIVPVKVGATVRWKAIFGNGYNSINNRAVLFIVDLETGAATTVQASEASQPGANGLGNVIAIDRYVGSTTAAGRDGYADTVYAGDQNGAVWKFDLRSASPAAQTVPFFVAVDGAGNRQPITGGFEAAAGPRAGVMLYFGTGSFSFVNDPSDKQVQTFYAILDEGSSVTRAELHSQTVSSDADGVRQTTMAPMAAGKRGWYIDLQLGTTATGERFVGMPRIDSGIIFFPTFDPNSTDACATGGTNRLYGLNSLSGAAALSGVRVGSPDGPSPVNNSDGAGAGALALDDSGSSPVKDVAVLTTPRKEEDVGPPDPQPCVMIVQAEGSDPLYLVRPCGRQSWRQIR